MRGRLGSTDWERPGGALLAAFGKSGEEVVARARLGVCVLLLIMPVYNVAMYRGERFHLFGLLVVVAATFAAAVTLYVVSRAPYLRWMGVASSVMDVSLVSVALLSFLFTSGPEAAALSRTTFEIYFLTISATALRYDRGTVVIAGVVAVAEYALLVWFCAAGDPAIVDPPLQATRIILLLAAVILAWLLSRRAEELVVSSNRDPVTRIANRAFFDMASRSELAREVRRGRPCALAVVDVDHFKRFNDVHGHKAGDRVLRVIAEDLQGGVRETDFVARWGGEEFVALLPDAGGPDALRRLDLLRQAVASRDVGTGKPPSRCTVSIGVACSPEDGTSMTALFEVADARLLRAKQEGRDRVVGGMDWLAAATGTARLTGA